MSLLAYPGSLARPFINPKHIGIAGGILRFSSIPQSTVSTNNVGSQIDLTTGRRGAPGANFSRFQNDGALGPVMFCNGGGAGCSFTGKPAVEDTQMTCAAIIRCPVLGNNASLFSNVSSAGIGTSGFWFGITNSGAIIIQVVGVTFKSANLLVAGEPYLIAASVNASQFNTMFVNLRTGSVKTTTTASGLSLGTTPDGTYSIQMTIGNFNSGLIGPVMHSNAFLGQAELTYWAKDPWGFWYDRSQVLG